MTAPTVPEIERAKEWLAGFGGAKSDALRAYIADLESRAPAPTEKGDGVVVVPLAFVERLAMAADCYGVAFLDSDDMPDEAQELLDATEAVRSAIAIAAAQQATGEGVVLSAYDPERTDCDAPGDGGVARAFAATQQAVSPPEGVGCIAVEKDAIAGVLAGVLPLEINWQDIRVAAQAFVDALPPAPPARPHRNAADGGSSNEGGE